MDTIYLKQKIEQAILEHKLIKMDYVSAKHEITYDRLVEPFNIRKNENGEPFSIYAHCLLKNGLREFQFEGIQKIELVDYLQGYESKIDNTKV